MVKHFTDASLGAPMAAGLDKLRAVLPTDRQDHVERLARQTVVYGSAFGAVPDSGQQPWLLALQKSVVNRHVLELRYATLIEENERDGGREFSHYTFLSNGSRGGSSRLGRPQKRLIRRSWAIGLRGSPKRRWRNIRSDQPRRVLLTRPSFPDSRSA